MKNLQIQDLVFEFIQSKNAYDHFYLAQILGKEINADQSESVLNELKDFDIIERKDSPTSYNDYFMITDYGKQMADTHKTFSDYKTFLIKEQNKIKDKDNIIKDFQIAEYQYKETIRNQENNIRNLHEDDLTNKERIKDQEDTIRDLRQHNLTWDAILKYKYLILFVCFLIGEIIGEFWSPISFFLRLIFPKEE
ncbi:MAG TPA: hypothetical protein VJY62_18975 [Bacteroidia bacterium]|nr:hypothetical protein [Bacteroidia bacterium]